MQKLDIPFNIDLLVLSDKAATMLRPVYSLDTFVGATKNFNPDGLFSREIFGVVGTPMRYLRYSYIDMKIPIIHPTIFKALGQIKALYLDILSRREFAVWDPELQDLVKSDIAEGRTGFEFFCEYFPRIKFEVNDSESRQMAVALLEKYRKNSFITKLMILPAGYREFEIDENGRESSHEINSFYYKIIAISNTINPITFKTSPEAYNVQRMSVQNTVMELYDFLTKIIEGKKNLFMGKMASRKVFNGTRNVITSMLNRVTELGDDDNITVNDTMVGLYQFSKAVLPVTLFQLRNGWLDKCFTSAGAPALLCDKKTLQTKPVQLKADSYTKWISSEGLEKQITYFKEETVRQVPIEIEDHYLGLVYRGPDGTFALIHGIDELPEDRKASDCTPLTMTELLYISLYNESRKYKGFATRYPITGIGSVYPSNSYLKTTIQYESRKELDTETWLPKGDHFIARQFPIIGSTFFNSLSPHPCKLAALGADHDGD